MKRFLAAVIGLLCLCLPAFAHPGRTDSKGGHTDRSTGEYHYHHGYSAHQHPNGECPYDFDDKTGASSGSSSKKSSSSSYKPKATPKPARTPKPTPTARPSYKPRTFSFQKIKRGLLIAALLAFPVGICVGMAIGVFIAIGKAIRFLRDNKWTIPFIVFFILCTVVGVYLLGLKPKI